jgi:hypothetical protein
MPVRGDRLDFAPPAGDWAAVVELGGIAVLERRS